MEIIWSDLAMHDLKDIANYVSDNFGSSISVKSINKIVQRVNRLKNFPESGVLDKPYSSKIYSVHHVTINPNIIYYLLEDNAIVIMTIVHVKRSPNYINNRLKTFLEHYE